MGSTSADTDSQYLIGSSQIDHEEEEVWSYVMTIAFGSAPPMVLRVVIELGVLEVINGAGPDAFMSPTEIAAQLPTSNLDAATMLDRMLCLLASYSLLSCSQWELPSG
ncbi:hypothetical protein Dimus_021152 [Dionaea muscipula]